MSVVKKNRPYRRAMSAVGAGAVLAMGGTVVWATAGASAAAPGNNVYTGCISASNGSIYGVKANSSTPPLCNTHDTSITFNQTGPQGAIGAQGATGAQGPVGAPGPRGRNWR